MSFLKKMKKLFPLSLAGHEDYTGMSGPTLGPYGQAGILIRLANIAGEWCVLVPNFEGASSYWHIGMSVPTQWMPIVDYLKMLSEVQKQED
jgi:hypothetical protein